MANDFIGNGTLQNSALYGANADTKEFYFTAPSGAGVDIADWVLFRAPKALTIRAMRFVECAAHAGVDAGNTVAVSIKNGVTVVASKTYDDVAAATTLQADPTNAGATLTLNATPANLDMAAGDVLKMDITQGATAAIAGTQLHIDYIPKDA